MSFSGTVIHTKKGLIAPEAFVRIALAKNPAVITVACVDKGAFVLEGIENPSLKEIMEAQDMVKDFDTVLHMCNYPKDFPEDSAQPFPLMSDDKGNPKGLLYLDGDFSNYAEAKSAHSPDFFAYQKYFNAKFEKWHKKGGLENVLEELRDVDTKLDIQNSFLARGNVVVFLLSGELFHIQKGNQDFSQFPWGYATNAYGYKEEPKASVPQAGKLNSPARRVLFGNRTKADSAPAPVVDPNVGEPAKEGSKSPAEAPINSPPAAEPDKVAASAQPQPGENVVEISWTPPIVVGKPTREDKKRMYDECPFIAEWRAVNNGKHYPEGYKQGRPFKMSVPSSEVAKYVAMGAVVNTALGAKLSNNGKPTKQTVTVPVKQAKPGENRANKDTTTHNLPAPVVSTVPKEDSNKHGYQAFEDAASKISPSEATMAKHAPKNAEVAAWFAEGIRTKFIDVGSSEVPFDPKTIQGLENQIRDATADAGLDGLENVLRLARPALINLNKLHDEWFVDLFIQLRHAYIKTLTLEDRPKPSEHAVETEQKMSGKRSTIKIPMKKSA
jgi:hypothetical protein